MAAGDKVQKGQQWMVEFGSFAYAGYLPETITMKDTADDEAIKDERNATISHILTDPRIEMTLALMIKSTGSITPPSKGDYLTLTPPQGTSTKYYCNDATVSFSRGISKLSLSLLREDSMIATYDA
jgi:hypothetical protein